MGIDANQQMLNRESLSVGPEFDDAAQRNKEWAVGRTAFDYVMLRRNSPVAGKPDSQAIKEGR